MLLDTVYFGNEVSAYLFAAGIFIGSVIISIFIHRLFFKRLRSWASRQHKVLDSRSLNKLERMTRYLLFPVCFGIGTSSLQLSEFAQTTIRMMTTGITTILVVQIITSLLEYGIKRYWVQRHQSTTLEASFNAIIPAIRIVVWSMAFVFILDNFGFDISAVVASLGIGGIAFAFAAQGILADLFSYFSIVFDRPFEIGDFIIVGNLKGTVEHIGIKSTRLRSIDGEQLVASNTDLTDSRIQNFKRMERRRIVFSLGVTYETGQEHLEKIPQLIQTVIEETDSVTFDRAHFFSFGDFSLNYEVVYFVEGNAYDLYMNAQQSINLGINHAFKEHNIEFAYPTQTLYFQPTEASKELKNGTRKQIVNSLNN